MAPCLKWRQQLAPVEKLEYRQRQVWAKPLASVRKMLSQAPLQAQPPPEQQPWRFQLLQRLERPR